MGSEKWRWQGMLGLMALGLAGALALIAALALGWNDPRPARPPDWEAPALPLDLKVAGDGMAAVLLGHLNRDFTVEVEALPLSVPGANFDGYGLVYRAQDEAHYYAFAVGSDGYYGVLRVEGEKETELVEWQQFPHVRRGQQANRLRVTCAGPMCHFYINDEYAAPVEDSAWLVGDVGLWGRDRGSGGAVVGFTHARVWTWP